MKSCVVASTPPSDSAGHAREHRLHHAKVSQVTDQQKLPLDFVIVFYFIFSLCVCVCVCVCVFFLPCEKVINKPWPCEACAVWNPLTPTSSRQKRCVSERTTMFRPVTLFTPHSFARSSSHFTAYVCISVETKKMPQADVVFTANLLACLFSKPWSKVIAPSWFTWHILSDHNAMQQNDNRSAASLVWTWTTANILYRHTKTHRQRLYHHDDINILLYSFWYHINLNTGRHCVLQSYIKAKKL